MRESLEEIRLKGLKALRKALGRVGMIRFLQQFDTGRGDYAQERHAWVDQTSLDDLRSLAQRNRKTKKESTQ